MSGRGGGEGSEAARLADGLPEGARVVALLYPDAAGRPAASSDIAVAVAEAVGARRDHTLLVGTEGGPGSLDERLARRSGPGLWDVLEERARLTEVAVRDRERAFTYLPAGAGAPGPRELVAAEAFRRFVDRVRERGGTLLLHLPEEAVGAAASVVDGCVSLAPSTAPPVASGLEEYGPRPAVGRWRRHRERARAPVLRAALGAAAILLLGLGWWALSRESIAGAFEAGGASASGAAPVEPPRPAEGAGVAAPGAAADEPAEGVGAGESAGPAGRAEAADRLRAVESAPELSYSVLIASYARAADAERRAAELGEEDGRLYFVAPTPVRDRLYHRVFAGARANVREARELMETLVARGRKDEASAWDLRPVRLAFRLGVYATRDAAAEAARRIRLADGVPAYVLPAGAVGDDAVFVVYAGAYESEEAARALGEILERAGLVAELTERRGEGR